MLMSFLLVSAEFEPEWLIDWNGFGIALFIADLFKYL